MTKNFFHFIIYFFLFSKGLFAQVFPVQVTPQMIPPHSLKLSDYSTAINEKVIINILLTDVGELSRQVGLRLYIENGREVNIQSTPVVINSTPFSLDGGVPLRLTNLDLQPYFELQNLQGISPQQYNQLLPDGLYQFCFEVYDFNSGQTISRKSCATAYLVINDPPILNLPFNGDQVMQREPQNIIFQWTPRHLNATNVQYEFTLIELWDNQIDPQTAFLTGSPLFQTITSANTLLYGPGETTLLPDKRYGWRVKALVTDGISETSVFRNNGFSEIFHFNYTGNCNSPQYPLAEPESATSERIMWQGLDHIQFKVQYKRKGVEGTWFDLDSYAQYAIIENLERGTTYEFRVGGQCNINGGFTYSQVNEFTTPISNELTTYSCGINPEIEISNRDIIEQLGVNDIFTAGDFPVTVKEVYKENDTFRGWGVIVVPYLQDTKLRVNFENIKINTDNQLFDGTVETVYDENSGGIYDAQEAIDTIEEMLPEDEVVAPPVTENQEEEVPFSEEPIDPNEILVPIEDDDGLQDDGITPDDPADLFELPEPTEPLEKEEGETETPSQPITVPPNDPIEQETEELAKIFFAGDNHVYSDNETINIENKSNLSFELKEFPENVASINWEIYVDNGKVDEIENVPNFTFSLNEYNSDDIRLVAYYDDKVVSVLLNVQAEGSTAELNFNVVHVGKEVRRANNNEKLYLVQDDDAGIFNETKNVEFRVFDNNNSDNDLLLNKIQWEILNGNPADNDFRQGGASQRKEVNAGTNVTGKVFIENELESEENVSVEWVQKGAVSRKYSDDINKLLDMISNVNDLATEVRRWMTCSATLFTGTTMLEKIEFKVSTKHEEDKSSRHVHRVTSTGLTITAPTIFSVECARALGIGDVSLGEIYVNASIGSDVGYTFAVKENYETKRITYESNIEGGIKLSASIGARLNEAAEDYVRGGVNASWDAGFKFEVKSDAPHLLAMHFYSGKVVGNFNFQVSGNWMTEIVGQHSYSRVLVDTEIRSPELIINFNDGSIDLK